MNTSKAGAMKRRAWRVAMAMAAAASIGAGSARAEDSCAKLDGCAAKSCRIDAQIAEATAEGKTKLLPALERARAGMAHCNDDGVRQKRKVALEQAQRRIDRREDDLKQAQAKNDAKKIEAARKRLESARHAYDEIKNSPL